MQPNLGDTSNPAPSWRPAQAYSFAIICLVIGLPIGYLIRGSTATASNSVAVSATSGQPVRSVSPPSNGGAAQGVMPSIDDMKRMANKQAAPLLAELEKKPKDAALLNKVALMYKAAHQFGEAATYFKKSLANEPKNIAVRDDYASCLYYLGDVDGALAELQKSLSYDPKHAGTLYNIGIIRWKGKDDVAGALVAWQTLLQQNPDLPQKDAIERLIAQAKQSQHSAQASISLNQ